VTQKIPLAYTPQGATAQSEERLFQSTTTQTQPTIPSDTVDPPSFVAWKKKILFAGGCVCATLTVEDGRRKTVVLQGAGVNIWMGGDI
jgi:hypothetical protein